MTQTRSALVLSMVLALALISAEARAQRAAPPDTPGAAMPSEAVGGVPFVPGNIGLHGSQTPDARYGSMAPAGATPGSWAPAGATPGSWAPAGAPDGSRAGALPPGYERETAEGVERQADVYLRKRVFGNAEERLNRGVGVQKDAVGAEHPDVAQTLERQAATVRKHGRDAGASEMEGRATEMRENLEQKARGPSLSGGMPMGVGGGPGAAPGVIGGTRP